MAEIRVISPEGEKPIDTKGLHAVALPDTWNEKEVFERVEQINPEIVAYISRDYTETDKDGNFVYNNAKVYISPEFAPQLEEILKADYAKAQEEYKEEEREKADPIKQLEKRIVALEKDVATLKGVKG